MFLVNIQLAEPGRSTWEPQEETSNDPSGPACVEGRTVFRDPGLWEVGWESQSVALSLQPTGVGRAGPWALALTFSPGPRLVDVCWHRALPTHPSWAKAGGVAILSKNQWNLNTLEGRAVPVSAPSQSPGSEPPSPPGPGCFTEAMTTPRHMGGEAQWLLFATQSCSPWT